jgi:DNA-binding PadR family transcriptional regulator
MRWPGTPRTDAAGLIHAACYSAERNMEIRTQPKDMVALTTLALLSEQPCHPYEIQRLLKERHKSYAVGKTRTLYRAIEELEAAGYIEPLETSREGKRPERTVYRITPEGSEELENWLVDLLSIPVDETPVFQVAVGLLGYITEGRAQKALATRLVALRAKVTALDATLKMAQDDLGLPRLVLLELEHAMALATAEIAWIQSIAADMETGVLVWNEELIRAHFEAMHAADAERRNRHRQTHLAGSSNTTRRGLAPHTAREETP